ncbi:Ig-like domain-containing protein, partial [Adlercreutzia sp. ZJ242]|uniref:Ig-like domain-containing protein n=1 Tax=Adlercreutzia sp. ZJ242 TaxID=2709409 RepID=UPI00197CD409
MFERLVDAKGTFEGKVLSVFLSVALVLSVTNVFAFAEAGGVVSKDAKTEQSGQGAPDDQGKGTAASESATSDGAKESSGEKEAVPSASSTAAVAHDPHAVLPTPPLVEANLDEAVVTFDLENAYVEVKGQKLAGTKKIQMKIEKSKDLTFRANANAGYKIASIKAKNSATENVPVSIRDGVSAIAADHVNSTLVVVVRVEADEAAEAASASDTTPITNETDIKAEGEAGEPEAAEKPEAEAGESAEATDSAEAVGAEAGETADPADATEPEAAEESEADGPDQPEPADADSESADPEEAADKAAVDDEVVTVHADVSSPAFEGYAYVGDVIVKVTAGEGILPEGTAVKAVAVESQDVIDAVSDKVEAQGKELQDAVAIDVTLLDKDGNAIQPDGAVNVCFFNASVEGEEVGVYRVSDDAAKVETIGTRQATSDVQSFDVDHFTDYVVAGLSLFSAEGSKSIEEPDASIWIEGDSEVAVGKSTQLRVKTNSAVDVSEVTWSTSDETKATVDQDGLVTGIAGGSVAVTAKASGLSAQYVVNVVAYTVSFYSNYPSGAQKFTQDGAKGQGTVVDAVNTYAVYQLAPEEESFKAIKGFESVNYSFAGWNTEADGSGTSYAVGDMIPVSGNEELYQQWNSTGEVKKISVLVRYHDWNGKPLLVYDKSGNPVGEKVLSTEGVVSESGDITLQLHKQENVGAANGKADLYAWAIGSLSGPYYPLGSVCTVSKELYTIDNETGSYKLDAYPKYGTIDAESGAAEFFVLKFDNVEGYEGNIIDQSNYYYVGVGKIKFPDFTGNTDKHPNIDYLTDASKNVNEYIVEAPDPITIANIVNLGIGETQGIRWYKVQNAGNSWHVDGMLYTVGKYWNVSYYDNGELTKREIVQDRSGFDIGANAPSPKGKGFDRWQYSDKSPVGQEPKVITGDVNVYAKYKGRFLITGEIDHGKVSGTGQSVYSGDNSAPMTFTPADGYEIESVTINDKEEDPSSVLSGPEKDGSYVFGAIEDVSSNWTVKVKTSEIPYAVTYTDGVEGEEVFADQKHENLTYGTATPAFDGAGDATAPARAGYTFTGWSPVVAETVTGDATYTAQWEKIPSEVTREGWTYDGKCAGSETHPVSSFPGDVGKYGEVTYEYFTNSSAIEGEQEWSPMQEAPVNVGNYKVRARWAGGSAGTPDPVECVFTINPAPLTVTTPDASKTYDGTALTAEGAITGFVNDETATFAT